MKNILFIITIILFSSCFSKSNGSNTRYMKNGKVPYVHVLKFEYENHIYITFDNKGIVHDPDCQYCYDKFD